MCACVRALPSTPAKPWSLMRHLLYRYINLNAHMLTHIFLTTITLAKHAFT